MQAFSPGRLSRMCVCFISAIAGIAYAAVYTYTESAQFEELFFASFILPLIRAPSLLLTAGTGIFLLSTFVAIYLAGGWDAAMGVAPKIPKA